jgi:hypothetical protein
MLDAVLQRAQELGLNPDRLDANLIKRSITNESSIYEEGQYFEAFIEDEDDVSAYAEDDNLFLHFNIPKTQDHEQNIRALSEALANTGDFKLLPKGDQ